MNLIPVPDAQDGIKLLDFLQRLLLDRHHKAELHRWIRTGQVRVNGGRSSAFDRLRAGDTVRLPPFAEPIVHAPQAAPPAAGEDLGHGLRISSVTGDVLVLSKPAGLPTQPGSGHSLSVSGLLCKRFTGFDHVPAPAHRLDKDTSGLLLAGLTHAAQRDLAGRFAAREGVRKSYLAWVSGDWPQDLMLLRDSLIKQTAADGRERMESVAGEAGDDAEACARLLCSRSRLRGGAASLLELDLLTGRTHQLRVQLASRGHPIIGDRKYHGRPFPRMLLHAWKLSLAGIGEFHDRPDWPAPFIPVTTKENPEGCTPD